MLNRWLSSRRRERFLRNYRPRLEHLEARATPAIFPFTVNIPQFHVFEDPDPDPSPFTDDEGDYYAVVKIGNNPEQFSNIINHGETLKDANWSFTQNYDTANGNIVQVNIYLMDDDDSFLGVRGGDDEIDINPSSAELGIVLFVDLTTGMWTSTGGNSAAFPANSSTGDDDDDEGAERGRIFFELDTDSDGLFNGWEINGIDIDGVGGPDFILPGANPLHKNLYVEMDSMTGFGPASTTNSAANNIIQGMTNGAPIQVTMNGHGLSTGQQITLSGVGGNVAANGTWNISVVDANNFTLLGSNGAASGVYVANTGTWGMANLVGTGLATNTAMDLVVSSFRNAPVSNPDGQNGINMHLLVDAGDQDLAPANWPTTPNNAEWTAFDNAKTGLTQANFGFGTDADRSNPNSANILAAKRLVYRYNISANVRTGTGSQGRAEIGGNDFMLTMATPNTSAARAEIFMHEFGHTVNLLHGGDQSISVVNPGDNSSEEVTNYKPNYLSIMNYTMNQRSATLPPVGSPAWNFWNTWTLDFSRSALPNLDETNLNEGAGIGGNAANWMAIGPVTAIAPAAPGGTVTFGTPRFVSMSGAVDWNGVNGIEPFGAPNPVIMADVNYLPVVGGTVVPVMNDLRVQAGFDDWSNVKFNFRDDDEYNDGVHTSPNIDDDLTPALAATVIGAFEYSAPAGNGADNVTLRRSGDFLELIDDGNGAVLLRRPFVSITYVGVAGASFEDDRLTVDFGGGNPIPGGGVRFAGGLGAIDTLVFAGTPPAVPQYVPAPPAGPEAGRINLGGSFVEFTGLEFVRPVAPEITSFAFGPAAINENDMVSLSGAFLDAGSLSSHSITINWGDGQVDGPLPLAAAARVFSATHRYRDDNPSVTPADTYNVTFTLTDNDSLTAVRTSSVLVNNVQPLLQNVAVTPEIDENGVVTLSGSIVDPGTLDTFTLVVDWGEGSPQMYSYPAGTTSFSQTHQYLDDNPTATLQDFYSIALNLRDDDSGADSAAVSTLVKNVAPVVTAFTSDAVECGDKAEGDTVHVVGAFIDVGTLDTHSATISWGDGAVTAATIAEGGGAGTIAGEHIYASGGIFRIVVTLTDDDTGQTTERTFALITGVGILDGQLQAVGTKQADEIMVNRAGNGQFVVHASFLPDSPRFLPADGVTSIAMILCDGDDRATISSVIDLPTYIAAEEGNDELNGGSGPNILLGGEGDDRLTGGSSHDILVGGEGADRIVGNGGDDILIAGTLGGAADPIDQLDSLLALLLEWELDRDRTRLRPKLVIGGDDDADTLTGSSGSDWFFFELGEDTATDLKQELAENLG